MTPREARETLLRHGFYSRWEGRRLVGGSHYKPGCPGVFEGIRFRVTLGPEGACTVDVVEFDDYLTSLGPPADCQDQLGWAVAAVLDVLWDRLDRHGRGASPNVPLGAALEAARALPTAKDELDLLSQLFMADDVRREHEWVVQQLGYAPRNTGVEPTAEALVASDPSTEYVVQKWAPPATMGTSTPVSALGPAVSYGQRDRNRLPPRLSNFHWAPLESRALWTTPLEGIPPFLALETPREMTVTLLMSAIRQVLELESPVETDRLSLIVFGSEPVHGKVTACFLGTKNTLPPGEKPAWLLEHARPEERALWMGQ